MAPSPFQGEGREGGAERSEAMALLRIFAYGKNAPPKAGAMVWTV